jgi:hypothetical protein
MPIILNRMNELLNNDIFIDKFKINFIESIGKLIPYGDFTLEFDINEKKLFIFLEDCLKIYIDDENYIYFTSFFPNELNNKFSFNESDKALKLITNSFKDLFDSTYNSLF